MKFHVDIELSVADHDADIMLIFAQAVRDRFDGTAIQIDKISTTQVIEVGPRDKKKEILTDTRINVPFGQCLIHSRQAGRIVYLLSDGMCPLGEEHEALLVK